ncbi:MAG TPA: oligosaccharide flippase family protein [Candidatus Sulfotelmatobacter sp.]|nr:oligosaccharide flippase family protein [Candidatus Sulfotelmatobacter sp.]
MKIIKRLLGHELISGSFYIFLGSFSANILAFFLNLFFARSLSYSDYAIFASLLSVITLASIPSGSINAIVVKFATNYFAKEENDKLKNLYLLFFKFILGLSIGVFLLFCILSFLIKDYLHIDNIWYVVVTGLTVSVFYLNTLNTAFLQSLLKFKFISVMSVFGGIIKLIIGIVLVLLGFRAFAGIWSIFFMMIGMFLIAFFPLSRILSSKVKSENINLNKNQIFSYALPTFITVLFLTSFTSTDVILVKHFFNPHLAGFYAGLSLLGKVIFYFTLPIPMVMFPLLVKRHASGIGFNRIFYLALILVLIPSAGITMFYFIRPNFVINLFLGGRDYLYVAKYLGLFGLYLTIFSMVNVCVNFFLSLNKTKVLFPVFIAAVLQIVLIYFFHTDFYQIIGVSILVSFALLIVLFFMFFKNYGSFTNLKKTTPFINTPIA